MYCYKKSDKNKENPIPLSEAVRFKKLWNKSLKIQKELTDFTINNVMLQYEDEDTKKHLYNAIDLMKKFRENLKLKDNMVEE